MRLHPSVSKVRPAKMSFVRFWSMLWKEQGSPKTHRELWDDFGDLTDGQRHDFTRLLDMASSEYFSRAVSLLAEVSASCSVPGDKPASDQSPYEACTMGVHPSAIRGRHNVKRVLDLVTSEGMSLSKRRRLTRKQ